jgi:hypothetical protein
MPRDGAAPARFVAEGCPQTSKDDRGADEERQDPNQAEDAGDKANPCRAAAVESGVHRPTAQQPEQQQGDGSDRDQENRFLAIQSPPIVTAADVVVEPGEPTAAARVSSPAHHRRVVAQADACGTVASAVPLLVWKVAMGGLLGPGTAAAAGLAEAAPATPAGTSSGHPKANVLLVHGAWVDGSSWSRVIPILQRRGHHVLAVQLPLTSLPEDVAWTRHVLAERLQGPPCWPATPTARR